MMKRRLRIALLIDSSRGYRRNLLRGIAAYARVHGPWSFFHHESTLGRTLPAGLRHWKGDGILVRTENAGLARELRRLKLPLVGGCGVDDGDVPSVESDHRQVVQLAIDHLREHGFQHFGHCGFARSRASEKESQKNFLRYVAELGHSASAFEGSRLPRVAAITSSKESQRREADLIAWIQSLPKPVGIMGCNDRSAHQVIVACNHAQIAVPDEVAVIGVDNDDVLCELCDPPLSSVDQNARRIGYEMASLLHRMIRGEALSEHATLIEPLGVVARESTDVTAIADRPAAVAMRFIRRHACEGIHIAEVCRAVGLSRSTLERRFARCFGHSPNVEIMRVQLARVKNLLATTEFPLQEIASMSGFNYVESMCYRFKKATGKTPGEFRGQSRV